MKLRTWLVLVVPLLILVTALVVMISGQFFIGRVSDLWRNTYADHAAGEIYSKIAAEQEKAKLAIETLLKNEEIIQAFADGDRERLIELVMPYHELYKRDFDFSQIHFHTADVKSFLRTSKLDKYGDDLSSFRSDIVYVKNNRKPVFSTSVGAVAAQIRYIAPIIKDGTYIGSVEGNINLMEGFAKRLEGDALVRLFFDEKGNRVDVVAKSRPELEDFTQVFNIDEILKGTQQSFVKGNYAYIAIPIKDFDGKVYAAVMQRLDVSNIIAAERQSAVIQLVISALIALVVAFASFVFGMKLRNSIGKMQMGMEKASKGDLTAEVSLGGKDEIAAISRMLNDVIGSIRQSVSEVVSSANALDAVSDDLKIASDNLTKSAEGFRATFGQVAESAKNATSSLNEITNTVQEVAMSATNIATAAQELSEKANSMSEVAKNSSSIVNSIVKMIHETKEKANETQRVVNTVAESAKNIREIVETINSISEQTNLLALNAAIEAARAGEAGRGFAVVADEIRKLAEESKAATGKIAEILGNIQSGVERANKATNETVVAISQVEKESAVVGKALEEILRQTSTVTGMVDSLAASSEELSASAEEMSSALTTATTAINEIVDEISTLDMGVEVQTNMTFTLASIARKISEYSEKLKQSVNKFKI